MTSTQSPSPAGPSSPAPTTATAPPSDNHGDRALRVAIFMGVLFFVASVGWDYLAAPDKMQRLLPYRGLGVALLALVGVISYPLARYTRYVHAAAAGVAAAGVCVGVVILPFGFAYGIGGLMLVAMAISFSATDWKAAALAGVGVVAGATITLLDGQASREIFITLAWFVVPGLGFATFMAHLHSVRAKRARDTARDLARLRSARERFGSNDELTGVADIKQLQSLARREISLSRRRKSVLSAVKIDIDGLQRINERHGRHAGDEVLRAIASMCQASLRETDLLGRTAGDEFAALLPEADDKGVALIRERLKRTLEKAKMMVDGQVLEVSVSVGLATLVDADQSLEDLLTRADRDLHAHAATTNVVGEA